MFEMFLSSILKLSKGGSSLTEDLLQDLDFTKQFLLFFDLLLRSLGGADDLGESASDAFVVILDVFLHLEA